MIELVISIASTLAAAAILSAFGLAVARITNNRKSAKAVTDRIIEWHRYIDIKLDTSEYNPEEVDSLEKEIMHRFNSASLKRYLLRFKDKVVFKYLERMGIKKSLRQERSLFYRYARLDHPSVNLALALQSAAHNKKYTLDRLPFNFYWEIIQGNYLKFYSQYKANWKNVKNGETKYTIADVEMPILLLKIVFNK